MKPTHLYRQAALDAQQPSWLGEIVLVRPITFTFLTGLAAIMATVILIFLLWGSYTKRTTVTGQLVPDIGLMKVYAPQPGIVSEKRVREGQPVIEGQVLYVLSSDVRTSADGTTQAAISRQIELRQQSLRDELFKTRQLQQDESAALNRKAAGLKIELEKIASQIDGQRSRAKLAEEAVARSQELLSQHYISREQMQQKQSDLFDQRNRLQELERDHITIRRELSTQQDELAVLPLRHQNQISQIERQLANTGQELTESESKRRLVIIAPRSGIATAVAAESGQTVDLGKPLISIVPDGARLQAHLYAPSKSIGFIKAGDSVRLRYQAYPYQKYGHAQGTVASVSRTALPVVELNNIGNQHADKTEPLYRITVELRNQDISAHGKPHRLQAGMLLDADILHDKRRLYEWVLEPLYSLSGKL